MDKYLSDGSKAEVGLTVKILGYTEGLTRGEVTKITSIQGMVINKSEHTLDLSRWKNIIQVDGGWLVNISNVKKV